MKTIDDGYTVETFNEAGELHSFDGNPAIKYKSGGEEWYERNLLHRLDGPATILCDGEEFWYYEGTHIRCKTIEKFEKIIKSEKLLNIEKREAKKMKKFIAELCFYESQITV